MRTSIKGAIPLTLALSLGVAAPFAVTSVAEPAQTVALASGCGADSSGSSDMSGPLGDLGELLPSLGGKKTADADVEVPGGDVSASGGGATLTQKQSGKLDEMVDSMSKKSTEDIADTGGKMVSVSPASKSGSSLMSAVAEVSEKKDAGSAINLTSSAAKSGVEVGRIATSAASNSGAVNAMVADVSALAVSIPRAAAGDPTVAPAIAQHSASLAGNGLGVTADVIRMYKASSELPQIKEVFGMVDPASENGKAVLAAMPKEARTPEIKTAMAATAKLGAALDALDFASMADLASSTLLGAAQGDVSCLASAPEKAAKSLASVGEAAKAIGGVDPGALGTVVQATSAGVAKAS